MKTAIDIVLKVLGALLIVAGALKGWQLLTEPVANNSIWTWRSFMVLQVDKDWFVTTPAVVLLTDGQVISVWEAKAPDMDIILESIAKTLKNRRKNCVLYQQIFRHIWHYNEDVL